VQVHDDGNSLRKRGFKKSKIAIQLPAIVEEVVEIAQKDALDEKIDVNSEAEQKKLS